jgi:hypothetical protein
MAGHVLDEPAAAARRQHPLVDPLAAGRRCASTAVALPAEKPPGRPRQHDGQLVDFADAWHDLAQLIERLGLGRFYRRPAGHGGESVFTMSMADRRGLFGGWYRPSLQAPLS